MNEQNETEQNTNKNDYYSKNSLKDRAQIKQQAKQNFHAMYGLSIGAFVLFLVLSNPFEFFYNIYNTINSFGILGFDEILGNAQSVTGVNTGFGMSESMVMFNSAAAYIMDSFSWSSLIGQASLLFSVFVLPPVWVGYSGFCTKIYKEEQTSINDMFRTGFDNYWRKVGGILWMQLFVFLWSLLLIIPGIIKSLAYFMTPYILADSKNVTAKQALKLSMRMTKGYKGEIFIMQLSFIGWSLLSMLTFGILGILYVNPYIYTSYAGIYAELKQSAISNGTILPEELE